MTVKRSKWKTKKREKVPQNNFPNKFFSEDFPKHLITNGKITFHAFLR